MIEQKSHHSESLSKGFDQFREAAVLSLLSERSFYPHPKCLCFSYDALRSSQKSWSPLYGRIKRSVSKLVMWMFETVKIWQADDTYPFRSSCTSRLKFSKLENLLIRSLKIEDGDVSSKFNNLSLMQSVWKYGKRYSLPLKVSYWSFALESSLVNYESRSRWKGIFLERKHQRQKLLGVRSREGTSTYIETGRWPEGSCPIYLAMYL